MFRRKSPNLSAKLFKICVVLFLGLMFMFPSASLTGAKRGLLLWFNTILPTLLPFIIISTLIIRLNVASALCRFLHPIIGKICHVSQNACYPIVIGFLSGIPMGAKTSADLVKDKKITTAEGQFLAILSNNASPMFILGYIALSELQLPNMKFLFVLLLYGSAILTAFIFRRFYSFFTDEPYTCALPQKTMSELTAGKVYAQSTDISAPKKRRFFQIDFTVVDDAIMDGFDVITKIGGYIILFSILAQIILSFQQVNEFARMLIVGALEITLGIDTIATSCLETGTKIVLILAITSFGGFSGMAQTKSVFADSGLSIRFYLKAKIVNTLITLCLALLYVKLVF